MVLPGKSGFNTRLPVTAGNSLHFCRQPTKSQCECWPRSGRRPASNTAYSISDWKAELEVAELKPEWRKCSPTWKRENFHGTKAAGSPKVRKRQDNSAHNGGGIIPDKTSLTWFYLRFLTVLSLRPTTVAHIIQLKAKKKKKFKNERLEAGLTDFNTWLISSLSHEHFLYSDFATSANWS